ncbi:MAG TPA: MFS transporter [Cytophagaceae bacterium]|jgi:UMF1 family MFS transporter
MEKDNKKTINAWCMYDWANSVYSLTITTAVFPEYFLAVTTGKGGEDLVNFLGYTIKNSVLYSYSLSSIFLISALISPFITSIADYTGKKKTLMGAFCYLGAFSCASLYFFKADVLSLGVFAFILAGVGYSGSIVLYNSYLPEIASESQYDRVSARGFSMGYIGSVILLVLNLAMITQPQVFGIPAESGGLAARISFLTVGIWWFVFAQYSFFNLPRDKKKNSDGHWLLNGWRELAKVWEGMKSLRLTKLFLAGFFLYSMGVQTVMYVAPLFAKKVLGLETGNLIVTILIIQLVAIPGAAFFNYVSGRSGNILALVVGIVVWILICVGAYFVQKGLSFYILASAIGFVMGGIQSLSRATYSKLIPENTTKAASWFSFYDVTEKLSIVLGTFAYGFIEDVTGTMRNSVIALGIFFILGLLFILRIPSRKIYAVKNPV